MSQKWPFLANLKGKVLFDEPLGRHTWLGVGGPADMMFFPEDEEDLRRFLETKPKDMPYFVLGGGSNILVRDGGIRGCVIKLSSPYFTQILFKKNELTCFSGMPNSYLKKILPEYHIGGLEFLASIPGTVGGLVKTNAGCFSKELKDVLLKARIMDASGSIKEVLPEELHLSYRSSSFAKDWIVIALTLKSTNSPKDEILNTLETQALYRKLHQPVGEKTAGSLFKNPAGYHAWELIKQSGVDGLRVGGAKLSDKHCNFMVNTGTASSEDLETLGNQIAQTVKEKTGVLLDWEVEKVGQNK